MADGNGGKEPRIDSRGEFEDSPGMNRIPPSPCRPQLRSALWVVAVAMAAAVTLGPSADAAELRVMTFNLWVGGDAGKQPLDRSVEVIRQARADIVGMQEAEGNSPGPGQKRPDNGRRMAEMLGWHYFAQPGRMGIASRYPIITNSPGRHGVALRLPGPRTVWMFNTHLNHAPYQPYQLLNIPYANAPFLKTAEQAVAAARAARGEEVRRLLGDVRQGLAENLPVFLTGDFNEPSHLDWTARAAAAGKCPLAVSYPSTLAVTQTGLRDAYRTLFPDEVQHPGWTWTPTTDPGDPKDRHDRIDFVFSAGPNVRVKRCEIVGERQERADLVVTPYPSDHRAVVATIEIP